MQDRQFFYKTVYNTARWKRLRMQHILSDEDNALCNCCLHGHRFCLSGATKQELQEAELKGVIYGRATVEPMFIVDHILALSNGGDAWSLNNLRSYCLSCHSRKTKRIDSKDKRTAIIQRTHEELEDFY